MFLAESPLLAFSLPFSLSLFYSLPTRDRIGTHNSAMCVKDLHGLLRGTTCCKNDNEVITEEIAYAIVADFPLFRLLPRYARRRLNCEAEIAEVAEFAESIGVADRVRETQ